MPDVKVWHYHRANLLIFRTSYILNRLLKFRMHDLRLVLEGMRVLIDILRSRDVTN